MAEEQLQGADAPKGKSKLLIIIIAVVVLLLGGGAAAFFLMGSDEPAQAAQAEQTQAQTAAATIAYVNIAQPFIFNVTGDRRDRLVQIKAQLMVRVIGSRMMYRIRAASLKAAMRSGTG